jgi:predicted Zn-dependent peptidase
VLAAAGNVDFDALVAATDARCGTWQPFQVGRTVAAVEGQSVRELIERENAGQEYMVQISGAPAAEDNDRYAARLLTTIFGDESGSRLFWALVDTGLADYAVSSSYEFEGAGIVITSMSCNPAECSRVVGVIDQLQRQLQTDGVTDDELELAKSKICSQAVRRAERPANRMFSVGNNWIQYQRYRTVRETVDAYQAVTRDDVRRVLDRFPYLTHTTVFSGPLKSLPY